jgi:hypothetical protein
MTPIHIDPEAVIEKAFQWPSLLSYAHIDTRTFLNSKFHLNIW